MCAQCSKWIHGRCSVVKRMTTKFSIYFVYSRKCEGNIGEAVEEREKVCDEVDVARECTYLRN